MVPRWRISSSKSKLACFSVLSILLLSHFFWNVGITPFSVFWKDALSSTDEGLDSNGVIVNMKDLWVLQHSHVTPYSVRKLQENTCKIPVMNPFEPVMMEFFKPSGFECSGRKSYFQAFVEEDEVNGKDKPMILLRQKLPKNFTCCYEHLRFRRSYPYKQYMSDDKDEGRCVRIKGNKTELLWDSQYVIVNCARKKEMVKVMRQRNGSLFVFGNTKFMGNPNAHSEILFYIPKEFHNESSQLQSGKLSHGPLNVIIMGYDQISRLNLIRMMSKSFDFLKTDLEAIDLQGYNKVGDATLNNTLAFITGFDFARLILKAKNRTRKVNSKFFDSAPWIWKDYAEKGYATGYSDDDISVFDYRFYGFKKQPTHVYLHPFMKWYKGKIWRREKLGRKHCIGNQRIVNFLQDHAVKVSRAFRDRPYFHFMWSTLSSQKNAPALVDQSTVTTLRYFRDTGVLNKSIVILLSDHGWRTGEIMMHHQGRMENLMPFAFLLLPKWFRDEYPLAYGNLKENQFRLTTPYDIHSTLGDILRPEVTLHNEAILERQREARTGYGVSLFLQIPRERTCEEAGVDEVWCCCIAYKRFHPESSASIRLGKFAVETINTWLKRFPVCRQYTLNKVMSAQVRVASKEESNLNVLDLTSENQTFKIAFSVKGGTPRRRAKFEVVVFTTPRYWTHNSSLSDHIRMSTEIFRLNSYGSTNCIKTYSMKKICTCS